MRPLSLELSAFGSYPGTHVIDFESLHRLGIFLVTGPTGTGKSTIFDAMVFALYGKLPGDRPESQVRSHYVAETQPTYVALEFEANANRYRIERSPAYMRAKKRGEGLTPESATCSISICKNDEWETLASKVDEVDDICREAVGLSVEQFERVVLLPQGKFQQFLLAETRERRPLLQALFGTRIYEDAAQRMRSVASVAKASIDRTEAVLEQERKNVHNKLCSLEDALSDYDGPPVEGRDEGDLSSDTLRRAHSILEPRLAALVKHAKSVKEVEDQLQAQAATIESIVQQWTRHDELARSFNELADRRDEIESDRTAANESRRIRPLSEADERLSQITTDLADARLELDEARFSLSRELLTLALDSVVDVGGSLIELTTILTKSEAEHTKRVEAFGRLEGARATVGEARNSLTEAKAISDRADERLVQLDNDLSSFEQRRSEILPLFEQLEIRSALVGELEEKVRMRSRLLESDAEIEDVKSAVQHATDVHLDFWQKFIAGNAPRMARELHDGEPCPVCGSEVHPDPALATDDAIIDFADVEQARSQLDRKKADLAEVENTRALLREQLGADAEHSIDDLEERRDVAIAENDEALAARDEIERLDLTAKQAQEEKSSLLAGSAIRATGLANADSAFQAASAELNGLEGSLGDVDGEQLRQSTSAFQQARGCVGAIDAAQRRVSETEKSLTQSSKHLQDLLVREGIEDLGAVRSAVLPLDIEVDLLKRAETYDNEVVETKAALATFDDVDLPLECPDATEARGLATQASEDASLIAAIKTTATQWSREIGEMLDACGQMINANQEEFARYELLDRVASRCEGKGQSKISLETWVLAGELDRVIAAANVHMARMTGSRYRLERTDDAGHGNKQAGLDLAIRDSFTGRTRPPASLSGGEQFQTSLSLALGLADVVSHGGSASGRTFEALFVDEGFGSLDPEALENAMNALEQIHDAGRMVGVITHVEAMKDALPIGIRVDRLPNGKGSTLTVQPET
ncbi:MAG: SMC family ATPase [Actinomycetes bacterium]